MEISSLDGNQFIELSEVFSQKSIPVTKDNIPHQEDVNRWPHLKEVKLPSIQAEVGLLIGANVPKAMEPLQVVSSVDDGPYAVRTILGWTVNGPLRGGSDTMETNKRTEVTANRISVAKLEELWQLQFKQDFPDAGQNEDIEMSKDDHQFMNMVSQSSKLVDGQYSVCLPIRNKSSCMPNNRSVAEQRVLNLRKRFSRDVKFHTEYVAFMEDILKKGYAVKLNSAECEPTEGRTWYLPHHGVRHPVKQKLRVVFDCGASFQGTSLNQQLLQGPDLTSSLVGVLMRFRQETVAVMADVEAMFHQIRVSHEDTDFFRFLWWPDGNYEQELLEHKIYITSPTRAKTPTEQQVTYSCIMQLVKLSPPNDGKGKGCALEVSNHTKNGTDRATVAVKMDKLLKKEIELELHDSIFWTDSTAVLNELKKSIKEWNTSKITKNLQQKGVQWHFNPPAGSHYGGSWERLIRSVRKILNTTVKEQPLDEEGLHTLLCEAEAIINSRPITKASSDLNDLEALTPNHLVLLKVNPELPPGVFNKDDQYANRRWRQVQYLADVFWKRWCKEYLPQLQERQRWSTPGRNFCIGDVVLIVDDTSPRNSWPLGRIVETFPDKKGFVRQVKVKTKTSELCHPVTKLCLLQESEDY
ncbi:hypothetical protein AAFF_G00010210 [Aldrovandia affinis]|uniref:DUF5641 domain-containing protein n=1 Tax=Aldrovandia affinis TaxID=143900 RepID=A0AAD7WHH8_9TELE|nr:hypothetical protein AAFF_G00010210 [Aldrovandia affinis]